MSPIVSDIMMVTTYNQYRDFLSMSLNTAPVAQLSLTVRHRIGVSDKSWSIRNEVHMLQCFADVNSRPYLIVHCCTEVTGSESKMRLT